MRSYLRFLPLVLLMIATPVVGGAHTWDVFEVFSNADGTIQFIEIREMNGTSAERNIGGGFITSNANSFDIPNNLTGDTTNKHVLFATMAFAALPGAPTPDFIIPANFFSTTADTISYTPYDTNFTFSAGQLPTDGVLSLNEGAPLFQATNSPTNYAGVTGTVNAAPPGPPPVPDGSAGTMPMSVVSFNAGTGMLEIDWDVLSCSPANDHNVLIGQGSDLPGFAGGTFALSGSQCSIGGSPPFNWLLQDAIDGSGLVWWLVVVDDGGGKEGSWGLDGAGSERVGPGAAGSSAECSVTTKDLGNVCP